MGHLLIALAALLVLAGCSEPSARSPEASESTDRGTVRVGTLLFKSGFGPSTSITDDLSDIVGTDSATGFSWEDTPGWIRESRFEHVVAPENDVSDFMHAEIVDMEGPHGTVTEVLHLQNAGDDPDQPATSRNEYIFFADDPPDDFDEGYVRYWTRLQEDLDSVIPADRAAPLYYLMEWKERVSEERGWEAGWSNFRINLGLSKDAHSTDLYWVASARQIQPERRTEWQVRNAEVAVPLGEWFLLEVYLKKHPVDGRLYVAVDGEVVFDVTARTEHATDPQPLRYWAVFKLYHPEDWLARGPTSQWYDDLEIWTGFPEGARRPPNVVHF